MSIAGARLSDCAARTLKILLAAACTMALQGCLSVEHVFPAMFADADESTIFDINVSQLAGDTKPHEIQDFLSSAAVTIEADYIPTKPIWLINSQWVCHWQGLVIPIPTWVLEPQIRTIQLKASKHKAADGLQLRFSAKRKISRYYMLRGIRVLLHDRPLNLDSPVEPIRIALSLRTEADLLYSSRPVKPSHQAWFLFNSASYAAAGFVKASNAYPIVHQIEGITTDLASPDIPVDFHDKPLER